MHWESAYYCMKQQMSLKVDITFESLRPEKIVIVVISADKYACLILSFYYTHIRVISCKQTVIMML